MNGRILAGSILLVATVASSAIAQKSFIYPQKGQTKQQQDTDSGACQIWARDQSGFDPLNPTAGAPPVAPAAPVTEGGAVRGAARGAAVGAIGGAIAGDAGKGAAIGAGVGGAGGAMRRSNAQRRATEEQRYAEQQRQSTIAAGRANFNRAFAACMEGRGYTVK
jgi:hypothetical protein